MYILSDPPIAAVFSDEGANTGEISDHQRGVMDDLGLEADDVGVSSMFTGEEEVFAFARCIVSPSSFSYHVRIADDDSVTVENNRDG